MRSRSIRMPFERLKLAVPKSIQPFEQLLLSVLKNFHLLARLAQREKQRLLRASNKQRHALKWARDLLAVNLQLDTFFQSC